MIALETALAFILRHWKLVVGGLAFAVMAIALLSAQGDARHYRRLLDNEKAARALDKAAWETASAKAIADNLAYVRSKEDDAATITETTQHDLEKQLASARALAARYAGSVRACAANPGSAGETSLPEASSAPDSAGATGRMSVVDEDDLRICSDAVVKARGWPVWYAALRERYNTDGTP